MHMPLIRPEGNCDSRIISISMQGIRHASRYILARYASVKSLSNLSTFHGIYKR